MIMTPAEAYPKLDDPQSTVTSFPRRPLASRRDAPTIADRVTRIIEASADNLARYTTRAHAARLLREIADGLDMPAAAADDELASIQPGSLA